MLSVKKVVEKFKSNSLDPVQLCKLCLRRLEDAKNLNIFITTTEKQAKKAAEKSYQRFKNGKQLSDLDGITIAVKDNFCVEGIKTTCGSKMLQNFVPPYTATVVQKLLNCGAVLIGKTNMDEFAMGTGSVDSVFGPIKNPWRSGLKYNIQKRLSDIDSGKEIVATNGYEDDFHICGGSSGGSAAAVALGASIVSLGSDTGGSTRAPAAMCGVVGLKPTYGTVSRYGLIPLVNSMDVPGILGTSVDDVASVFSIISGHDPKDSTTISKKYSVNLPKESSMESLRVGIPKEFHCPGMSSEVVSEWQRIADMFSDGRAEVTEVSLPHTQHSIACYSVLNCCEVASNMARYDGIEFGLRSDCEESTEALFASSRSQGFNEVVRGRILAGNYFLLKKNYKRYFEKALRVRRLILNDYLKAFSSVDLILTPVTLSDAPRFSEFSLKDNREQVSTQDYCTQPVNMAGLPAVSIPVGLSRQGLPIGMQLIGNYYSEEKLLTAAKWLENMVDSFGLNVLDVRNHAELKE